MTPARLALIGALLATLLAAAPAAPAAEVRGTLRYENVTKDFKHGYFLRGPETVESSTIIKRLIFATDDIGATLRACATMSCAQGKVTDGLIVDSGAGPQLRYSLVLKDGIVQTSGTAPTDSLTLTADAPSKLAGKLKFDATSQGGPTVDMDFDLPLLTEFKPDR
jgi:hypothetical protein